MNKAFITLDNDVHLAYQIYGKGKRTVILFHGLVGGSRLNAEMLSHIDERDIRVITLERFGYGDSSQVHLERIADWVPFMKKVAAELNIKKTDIIGISAGAPYAYMAAYALPEVVEKVWILSGVPAVYEADILCHYEKRAQSQYRELLEADFIALQEYYTKHIEKTLKTIRDGGEQYLIRTMEEIIKQNCYGMALESKLQITPWGFDAGTIEQPLTMYHSRKDKMIPFKAAREMSSRLRKCEFIEVPVSRGDVHIESSAASFLKVLERYEVLSQ